MHGGAAFDLGFQFLRGHVWAWTNLNNDGGSSRVDFVTYPEVSLGISKPVVQAFRRTPEINPKVDPKVELEGLSTSSRIVRHQGPQTLDYPNIWICIPIYWASPAYGDSFPYFGLPHHVDIHPHILGYPDIGATQYREMHLQILGYPIFGYALLCTRVPRFWDMDCNMLEYPNK